MRATKEVTEGNGREARKMAFWAKEPFGKRGVAFWQKRGGGPRGAPGENRTRHWAGVRRTALPLSYGSEAMRSESGRIRTMQSSLRLTYLSVTNGRCAPCQTFNKFAVEKMMVGKR